MNEILKSYAQQALEWLSKGVAFVAEEIPIYIAELLKWKAFEHGAYIVIGFSFIVLFFILLKKYLPALLKWDYDKSPEEEDRGHIYTIIVLAITFFMAIGGINMFFGHIFSFIQIMVAPRIFLLEYVTDMLSSTT
jgi:hypothetical protein